MVRHRRPAGRKEVARARVTTASPRADLANYKAEVQRRRTEITLLRDRLSEALRSSYAASEPEADRLGLLASQDARQRIAELEQEVFELQERVPTQSEELEGVRDLNGELMAQLNTRAQNAN